MRRAVAVSRTILCASALAWAVGCDAGVTEPARSLGAARARWAQSAPAAYSMTVARSCECLPAMSGPVVVTVRHGVVTSRRYVRTGEPVAPRYAELFPAVEGLFALVDAGVRSGTRPLEARYHPTLGYPTRIVSGDPALDAPVTLVVDFRTE